MALLETAIQAAINDGFVTFISGMARGVDIWAAGIVVFRLTSNTVTCENNSMYFPIPPLKALYS